MTLTVLRISVFLFSLYGWSVFFSSRVGLDKRISPIASCCAVILILYAASFIGLLQGTATSLFAAGVLLAVWQVYQAVKNRNIHFSGSWAILLLLGFYFLLFGFTLLQSHLEHYDNYSHWAVIVKFLYTEGRLPTAADTIISFTSYPIGSSLFVYYAAWISGFSDGVMLMGQFILIFCSLYALFTVVRDEKRTLVIVMMLTFLAIFNHFNIAIRMNNLLVDFLLPVLTLAGLAGMYRMQRQLKQLSLYFFLIAGTLSIVKNSALFFVGVLLFYFLSRLLVNRQAFKGSFSTLILNITAIIASFLPFLIWNNHVKHNFPESKHEVSLSAYQDIFGEKSASVTQQITDLFVETVLDPRTLSTQGILLLNVIFLAAYLIIRFGLKRKNRLLFYGILTDLVIVAYYIGIYLMFQFSMPTEEALYLAGFERYASSIVILGLGILLLVLAREMDYSFYEQTVELRNYRSYRNLQTKKWYQYSIILLLFFAILLLLSENNGMIYNAAQFERSVPAKMAAVTNNEKSLNQERYLIVSTDKEAVDSYLVGYAGKYYLYSPYVDGREDFMMDDQPFIELLEKYDKVVILEDHFTFNAMTEKVFSTTFNPGIYEVADMLKEKNNK